MVNVEERSQTLKEVLVLYGFFGAICFLTGLMFLALVYTSKPWLGVIGIIFGFLCMVLCTLALGKRMKTLNKLLQ